MLKLPSTTTDDDEPRKHPLLSEKLFVDDKRTTSQFSCCIDKVKLPDLLSASCKVPSVTGSRRWLYSLKGSHSQLRDSSRKTLGESYRLNVGTGETWWLTTDIMMSIERRQRTWIEQVTLRSSIPIHQKQISQQSRQILGSTDASKTLMNRSRDYSRYLAVLETKQPIVGTSIGPTS